MTAAFQPTAGTTWGADGSNPHSALHPHNPMPRTTIAKRGKIHDVIPFSPREHRDRVSHEPPMVVERSPIPLRLEIREQARRSLDVREEQRDSPTRWLGHPTKRSARKRPTRDDGDPARPCTPRGRLLILVRVTVWRLALSRAAEAVEVLLEVFPDFPGSSALDPAEEKRIARLLHQRTVESGLASGRVDVWGDPPVGIAVWLRRPALGEPELSAPARPSLRDLLPAEVVPPLARFEATMQRLRAIARPDPHVYLDMLGVQSTHRRHGIATALMEAGHAWADGLGLPTALDTDTDENVAFYERRGYAVVGRERLSDADRDLVAMRRRGSAVTAR
jgi:GNAT superfamily N-acetyltransferase